MAYFRSSDLQILRAKLGAERPGAVQPSLLRGVRVVWRLGSIRLVNPTRQSQQEYQAPIEISAPRTSFLNRNQTTVLNAWKSN